MAAVWTRLRAELRRRWRAWGAVAFLIGVAGGIVLTAAGGARRTASAYPRFLRASAAADLLVSPDRTGFPDLYRTLARAPGATVVPVIGYGAAPVATPHQPLLITASPGNQLGVSIERPKIIEGRMLLPDAPAEVVADVTAARAFHLHPGSSLTVRISKAHEEQPSKRDTEMTLHVVGIGVTRDNIVTVNALATAPTLLAAPAFTRRFGPADYAFDGAEVRLASGTSKAAFTALTQTVARRLPETGGNVSIADESQQAAKVTHAIRPQAVALGLFAALTALTALFAVGQVLARRVFLASTDNEVLAALGMSRWQLLVVALAEAGTAAIAGALLAVVIAIVASPTMPIGPARVAEPHPGIMFDWTVLGIGFVGISALFILRAAWPAWRLTARHDESGAHGRRFTRRPAASARLATTVGAPPNAVIGIGYAVEHGRGRSAVPARGAIAVTALAVAAIAATITFGTNLSRLVHTPRLYGQSWDVTVDAQFSELPLSRIDALLRAQPGVTAWTFGTHTDVTIAGQIVPGIALVSSKQGLVAPTIVAGRAADRPNEIALGTKTLDHIHRRVGDTVVAELPQPGTGAPPPQRFRIVGRSVFPFFGEGSFTPTGLGVGAEITEPAPGGARPAAPVNFVIVRVAPGAARAREIASISRAIQRAHICGAYNQCTISTTIRPTDVLNYARIQSTPLALAAVLVVLALGVVTSLLVTSIRRRRHDLAILKTLGFERRQISMTIAWQATTLVVLALAVGLPVGTALGRWVWTTFATNLGIPGDPHTPVAALLVAIPLALVIGNAIAAAPGVLAGRQPAAAALRAE